MQEINNIINVVSKVICALEKNRELGKIDGLLGPRTKFEIVNRPLNILLNVRSEENKEIRERAI